jgi:hypothetical protein
MLAVIDWVVTVNTSGGGKTSSSKALLLSFPSESTTLTKYVALVNSALGLPVISPLLGLNAMPKGKLGGSNTYSRSPSPPLAVTGLIAVEIFSLIIRLTKGTTRVVVTGGGSSTVNLKVLEVVVRLASVMVTVMSAWAKTTVGLPDMNPVDELIVSPVGKPVALKTYGVLPPDAVTGLKLVTVLFLIRVTSGSATVDTKGGSTVRRLNVPLSLWPRLSVAVTV